MTRNENDGRKSRGGSSPSRDRPAPRSENPGPRSAKAPARPRSAPPAADPQDAKTERQRIAKVMARAGLCSRRDAEGWIVEGRVSVNGVDLTSPAIDVGPEDVILVDGAPLPAADKTRLFLFHKPRGLITSDHDPEGRDTIFDHLREHWPDGPRVVTVGRLDINTEGLLLLTNDGGLARVLELPQTGWVRRYRVRAKGQTDQAVLDGLVEGVTIEGIDYAGIEAKLDRIQGANCWLTMGLREGKNREVKRVLEHIGLDVNRLIRLSFGPFQLLDLPEGHVEEVKTRILRDQLGPALSTQAGVDFSEPEPIAPIVAAPKLGSRDGGRDRKDRGRPERAPVRGAAPSPRGRNFRERDRDDEPVAPEIRERPVSGPRRHVSALRSETGTASRSGPRKRLERTDTTDRKNRTVTVERLVSSAPASEVKRSRPPRAEPGSRRERPESGSRRERPDTGSRRERPESGSRHERPETGARRERSEAGVRRERPEAGARRERPESAPRRERPESAPRRERSEPAQRRERSEAAGSFGAKKPFAKEGHASQSALGKRERIARSGPLPDGAPPRARAARSFSNNRAARSESFETKRAKATERRESRPPRRDKADGPGQDRPTRTFAKKSFDSKPARGAPGERRFGDKPRGRPPRDDRPATGRARSTPSFGDRPPRSGDGGKPQRPRGDRPGAGAKSGRPAKSGPPRGKAPGGKAPIGRPPRPRG